MTDPVDPVTLRRLVAGYRAELDRIGRINTTEDRDRVVPELMAWTWLNELEAALAGSAVPKPSNGTIGDHYGSGWVAGVSLVSTCRRCGEFLGHGHQCAGSVVPSQEDGK